MRAFVTSYDIPKDERQESQEEGKSVGARPEKQGNLESGCEPSERCLLHSSSGHRDQKVKQIHSIFVGEGHAIEELITLLHYPSSGNYDLTSLFSWPRLDSDAISRSLHFHSARFLDVYDDSEPPTTLEMNYMLDYVERLYSVARPLRPIKFVVRSAMKEENADHIRIEKQKQSLLKNEADAIIFS